MARFLSLRFGALFLSMTGAAHPALAAPTSGSEPATAQEAASLEVELRLSESSLVASSIFRALEQELGVPVRAGSSGRGLTLAIVGRELRASYRSDEGRVTERTVSLPEEPARQLDTVALLAGNLARDEAGRLLAELRGSAAPPPAAPAAPGESAAPESTASAASQGEPAEPTSAAASGAQGEPATAQGVPATSGEPAAQDAPAEEASNEAGSSSAPASEPSSLERMPFHLSLFAPVALSPRAFEREISWELGLFYSDIGRLRGVGLQGFVLENRGGGSGLQIAGIWSMTGGDFEGVRIAGLVSNGSGGGRGIEVAGLWAQQAGDTRGLQVSLVDSTAGQLGGAQIGLVNHVGAEITGAQIGLVNVGGGLSGAQIGLVNVQNGPTRGTQIGLVNIARESKGASFGLVQVSPSIRTQALAWVSWSPELGSSATPRGPMAHVGVKYLMGHFYTILGFGVADADRRCPRSSCIDGDAVLAPSFAAGGRVDLGEPFFVELDSLYQWEFSSDAGLDNHHSLQARATLGWQVTEGLALVAGGGVRGDSGASPSGTVSFEGWSYSPSFHAGIQVF